MPPKRESAHTQPRRLRSRRRAGSKDEFRGNPRIHLRTFAAMARNTRRSGDAPSAGSLRLELAQTGSRKVVQSCQSSAEHSQSPRCQAIGLASFVRWQRLNEFGALEARNRAIKRAGAQSCSAHTKDIFDHGVAVLRAVRETSHDQQRRIGVSPRIGIIYVVRTSCHVVMYTSDSARRQLR
jgi:hypothetical protein